MKSTVLLVDDDLVGLRVRAALLKSAGYRVLLATTGAEALVQAVSADLVVLDYCLSDMTGVEVLNALHASCQNLPVIVLTGMLGLPCEVSARAATVLVKGDGAQKLLGAVAVLSNRR